MQPKTFHCMQYVGAMLLLYITLASVGCSRVSNVVSSGENKSTSSTWSNKPNAEIDACALITKEDAERILGEPVKEPQHSGAGGDCMYEITEYGIKGRAVNLLATISRDSKQAYEMHRGLSKTTDKFLSNVSGGDDASSSKTDNEQELSGIGDKAYMTGAFRGGFMGSTTTISALKGDVWVSIQIIGTPRKGSEEELKAVAKKVVDSF